MNRNLYFAAAAFTIASLACESAQAASIMKIHEAPVMGLKFATLVEDHDLTADEIENITNSYEYFINDLKCKGPLGGNLIVVVYDESSISSSLKSYSPDIAEFDGFTIETDVINYFDTDLYQKMTDAQLIGGNSLTSVLFVKRNPTTDQTTVANHEGAHSICQQNRIAGAETITTLVQDDFLTMNIKTSISSNFKIEKDRKERDIKSFTEIHARMLDISAQVKLKYGIPDGTIAIPSQGDYLPKGEYPYDDGVHELVANLSIYGVTYESLFTDLAILANQYGSDALWIYANQLNPQDPHTVFRIMVDTLIAVQDNIENWN